MDTQPEQFARKLLGEAIVQFTNRFGYYPSPDRGFHESALGAWNLKTLIRMMEKRKRRKKKMKEEGRIT